MEARNALARGDVRRARTLARQAAASLDEDDRAEARALLERIAPDRRALLAGAIVLLAILVAAWLAILHRH